MPVNCIFRSNQVAVTDSGAALFDTAVDETRDYYGYVKNIGGEDVYVGCSAVTSDCGFQLGTDEKLDIKFYDASDSMSAICAEGESTTVCWFLAAY
ncbi:hypothetical protein KAR91_17620 [Candidatus Pacearchaeota archaeon]|nr:hypothetical protein [Candidatus Pacearchaeota archaeon]